MSDRCCCTFSTKIKSQSVSYVHGRIILIPRLVMPKRMYIMREAANRRADPSSAARLHAILPEEQLLHHRPIEGRQFDERKALPVIPPTA